ncbi:hypothetical protein [Methanosarcina mazei]|uniref:Uncharacterized protein n=1 Tax=Methanosarcina mazei WWM610 TaxID=1434117 RepID=A0A0E3PYT7_METMZ|nr:hypothetical protein [Methanosarcina mazei]AKB40873.1 hypothetical protein MSMAW_1882 [Methanosarcina mazei WWM610]
MVGEWYKDYAAVQRRTPAGAGGASWAAYLKAKNATSEGYERAFKELDIAARQEGVTVNRPAMTAGMSQAQYQEVLQKYLVNINNEVLKKNVTNALKDIQKQGMQAGVNVGLPTLANLTNANADSFVNNYINTVNQRIYINYATTAIKDLQAQGVANGVNVPIPAVSNTVSQAQAQEIVNKYQSQVNSALLVKSTQDALKSVQSQAKSYGVNVAAPTVSANITEQAANALVDRYVADVNAKLTATQIAQPQTASKINNTLVGSTVTAPSVSIARNSDGSLAVNEGLYNQLKAAQTQYKSWWNDYSGIPQQVIDSQATDVRINSKGQFEWTPVTAADKAQLEKINAYRTRSGLAPHTTLIHGPEKSTEYNTKWLSTTGSGSRGVGESGVKVKDASGKTVKSYDYNTANLAKVGSGDIKIASVKAGSSVNANATAKTNTAQSVKAVKLTQKEIAANHPGQIQLKDGTWINQVQGSQGIKETVKIISAVKSLEEADKLYQQKLAGNYNPESRKDITVGDIKTVVHGTVTNELMKEKHDQTIASTKEFKKQLEAFNDVLAEFGTVSIVTQGHRGTGEGNVFVGVAAKDASGKTIKNKDGSIKYIARSQSAATYKQIERQTPKLAGTAILAGMSAADKKAIEAARERMLLGLKFAEATKLKTEWANTDYNTNKAFKLYNSALGKYNVVDFDSFAKEFADIEKATRGMSETEKKKYLLDVEKSKLPEGGKASDLWRTLNTDVFEALKISPSMAGVLDGWGGKKAVTVKWDARNANVDEKLAGVVKSNSMADVIDNISNKQVNGKPLTANEVSLLTAISAGYKPGATTANISALSTRATEAIQNKMQTYQKNYKAGDNFAGVRLSTSLAEWANDLQAGALSAVGVVGATVGGAPQAAGYVWSQAKGVKSYDSAKNAASTVGLAAGLVGTQMTRGMAKSYHEDKSKFVAELVLTQALFSGVGKAGKYGVVKPTKYTALKTGVIRTKTLGSEIIPHREAGTILDTLRYEKKVTGMHASNIRDSTNKKVFVNNPKGVDIDPSTFGKKGRFATVSDQFVDPFGEYFLNKGKVARFNKTIRLPAKEVKSKIVTTVKGKFVKTTTDFNEYGGTVYKNEFRNPALSRAAKKAENVKAGIKTSKAAKSLKVVQETKAGKAAGWVASKAANIPKKNYAKNKAKFTTRNVRTSEKVVDRVTADAVKLTETQWNRIYKKFSEKGEFWDEYKKVTDIAQKQADKTGKPVAIPSPKVAKGMMEAENEVFLIFPKKGVRVASKQKLGKTKQGVEVYEVRYGKQEAVAKKSVAQRMKENREYNKQMVKAVDGKKYNLNYIKSYANDANRRLGELYGSKTTRPGAYEQGAHGKKHTEQVGKNVASLGVEQETSYWLGVMHDVTKIGPHESAGIPHAIAAAEAIKRGLIQDARFNKFYNGLSKAKQKEFYKAVGEHTTIKPINRHLLTEWDLSLKKGSDLRSPVKSVKGRISTLKAGVKTSIKDRPSTVSKALANADRMDLTRFDGTKIQKRQMFGKLKDSAGLKAENKVKNTIKAGSKKLSVPNVKTRVRNALRAETKTATSQNKVKIIEKKPVKQTEAKSQYKKPEKEYTGNKYTQAAKAYGSLAAYNSGLASASKYLKSAETKGSNAVAGYKKSVTPAKQSYKAGYNKPKSGVKSGYYKQSKEYKSSYKPSYSKNKAYKPAYVTPYAKKSEYSGKYAKGGKYESGYGSVYKAAGYGSGYNGGYGSGYGGGYGGGYPRPAPSSKVTVMPRAKAGTKRVKVYTDRKNFERDIKNVLGSLKSMFG